VIEKDKSQLKAIILLKQKKKELFAKSEIL